MFQIRNHTTYLTERVQKLERNLKTVKKLESTAGSYEEAKKSLEVSYQSNLEIFQVVYFFQ